MGYSTTFKGELKFTVEPTSSQLAALKKMFGADCRDHPEWKRENLYYVDLEFTDDFSGLCWSGAEKTYALEEIVNLVLEQMRHKWPFFGLSGQLAAQGEDVEDRWMLIMGKDGLAHKKKLEIIGKKIICPHCERSFIFEDELIP